MFPAANDLPGRKGNSAVAYTCPVPAGAELTLEFRKTADGSEPGAIDPGHKGPCAVYLKRVDDMYAARNAAGRGWFKIWSEGHDDGAGKWCTEKLIAAGGLLTVRLPSGLPAGSYLVRAEVVALHDALQGDVQYFVNCAQIFVTDGPGGAGLSIPEGYEATIPGYVDGSEPGLTFNIYSPKFPYPIPGPPVYFPSGTPSGHPEEQTAGAVPDDCLLTNGNWCGIELAPYHTQAGCWDAARACDEQGRACYASAPATGDRNCGVWNDKCVGVAEACEAHDFEGPPGAGTKLKSLGTAPPGQVPKPYDVPAFYSSGDGSKVDAKSSLESVNVVEESANSGTGCRSSRVRRLRRRRVSRVWE